MNRTGRIVLALVAAQAVLVGVFWWVERDRAPTGDSEAQLGVGAPAAVNGRMQGLWLTTREGERIEWKGSARPTLMHFWATWCPPCRAELPGILALAEDYPVDVVAVALDEEWADVDRFFAGRSPSGVFLGDSGEVERELGIRTLPVTYLVEPGGEIRLRFDGARDWTDTDFTSAWIAGPAVPSLGP
jgi:thiol-disulfide isomerase/thioredoxin